MTSHVAASGSSPHPAQPLLEVDGLTIRFGRAEPVVRDVAFALQPGERVGLIGESGSGKSLTALSVLGLLPPSSRASGQIRLTGTNMIAAPERRLRRLRGNVVSMVFQEPMTALDPTMTVGRQVGEVVRLHAGARRASSRPLVLAMLAEVGLTDPARIAASFPHQLSGGQRQRVVIAMAMINRPRLIICDEPTTALDVTMQATVLSLLRRSLDRHETACLFISHDLAVVAQVCDRVMVMRDGRLVEQGSLRAVFGAPQHPYTAGLVATSRLDVVPVGERLPTVADYVSAGEAADTDGGAP